jgi:hypothetical protein
MEMSNMSLVNEIFDRVAFDEIDRTIHQESYQAIKQIARVMDEVAPDSVDKILAFRALHVALMHFGAALSRQKKYNSP